MNVLNTMLVFGLMIIAFIAGVYVQQRVDSRTCVSVSSSLGPITYCSKNTPTGIGF